MSGSVVLHPRSHLAEVVQFRLVNKLKGSEVSSMHASVASLVQRLPRLLEEAPMDLDRSVKLVSLALLSSKFQDTGSACINFGWGSIELKHWAVWP
jgi:hypothetical protein